jgi:hypothetical protein
MDFTQGIYKLYPQVIRTVGNIAYDADDNEVAYDKDAVQAYVDANAYKAKRAAEYPSIADQLDKIFHDGIDEWKETIQAIKDKYPKS